MLKRILAATGLAMFVVTGAAQAQQFQEGTHYRVLERSQSTVDDERIELREFFSYACPFCHQFYPVINNYMRGAPDDVVLVHHPVVFRDDWEPLARAYFVAEQLDIVDDVHGAIFVAYHEENMRLRSVGDAQELFTRYADVDADAVADAWDSFGVETSLRRYDRSARVYGVRATPSLGVNGKYYTDARMAGGADELLQVVDYLIERERQAGQ
ncbi:thiol:disulfide interchange protein DsbA [Natronocella acetinitrilica]|uniref:Thiol:disulfide interchange protein n=1 Tax=Natronocella acetinitrilica TaxID=414046 RepID=A0AAE3G2D1_9GAMM|nr:thiol:disulfide interchange protein DsbA/DsbL [Natronocella acetinitrilica]MCP1673451.1 thiol:disulfide interchange protein DsbA [Natronocella acetinitrilica]